MRANGLMNRGERPGRVDGAMAFAGAALIGAAVVLGFALGGGAPTPKVVGPPPSRARLAGDAVAR